MVIKRDSINKFIFYLYFILFTLSIILPLFGNLYSKYSLIIEFCLIVLLLIINFDLIQKDSQNILLISVFLFFSVLSIFFTNGGLGSLFNSFHFLGALVLFKNMNYSKNMQSFIFVISLLLFFFNVKHSFNVWNLYIQRNSIYNPNSIALFIFLTVIIILSNFIKSNKKFLVFPLLIISFYCIYITNCRSVLFALLLYCIISFFPVINKMVLKYKKYIIYILIIIGTIFPLIYAKMYENNVMFEIPCLSKSLYTGREHLWLYMLKSMSINKYSYLFGLGTNYFTEIGVINNYHNWFLGVLYTFGLPTLIIYFSLFARITIKLDNREMIYALIAVLLIGYAETLGLWSVAQNYIFMCIIVGKKCLDDNSIYSNV